MAQATTVKTKSQYKVSFILWIILAVVFTIVAAIDGIIVGEYMFMGKTKSLNQIIADGATPEKGDYVTLHVRFVLGNFAETKHKINGFIPAGTDQHYAIVLDDGSVMPIMVKSKSDIEKLEAMVTTTVQYLNGETKDIPMETLELQGCIESMDKEIEGFYKQALNQVDITDANVNIRYLTMDATQTRFSKFLIFGFLVLMVGLCIFLAIMSRKKMKELSKLQSIARENAADPMLNPFLNSAAAQMNPYAPAGTDAAGNAEANIPQQTPDMSGMNPQMPGMNPQMPGMNPQMPGMNQQMPGMNQQMPGMNQQMPGMSQQATATEDALASYTPAQQTTTQSLVENGIDFPGSNQ